MVLDVSSAAEGRPGRGTGSPVLIVGLDMADGALIRHWSDQGRLPALAALASSGQWIDLESTAEVLHTSTWPTFATGTLPGRHGVYYPYQPKPGHQLPQHIAPEQYGEPTFWQSADAAGRRCVLYDVPETFPESRFGGRAIFDWGTWAWYGTPAAQPAGLLKELKKRFGPYPLGYEAKRLALGYPRDIEQRLLRSVRYKSLTSRWLIERHDWDLAVVGFCETHPAGHYLWPADVDAVTPATEMAFAPLFSVYSAIDHALGELRAAVPRDCTMMIVSGDGVRPNRCGWHLLPAVLERLGYACQPAGPDGGKGAAPSRSLLSRAQSVVPPEARRWISAKLPWWLRDQLGMRAQAGNIDWTRTRAFALPTDLEGCIRINLKGREPLGIVEPGAEYTGLCEEIRTCLQELMNPATGAPAVRRVWIRNDVFPGARQEHLPDIIFTWDDAAPIVAVTSPRVGLVEGVNPDVRSGTHSPHGFLLVEGAGVRRAPRSRARLIDVAPTAMKVLGLDWGRMDGRALELGDPTSSGDRLAPAIAGTRLSSP
jgi:predicted AlkP superfamily phosphohydrolase/phosphomutase